MKKRSRSKAKLCGVPEHLSRHTGSRHNRERKINIEMTETIQESTGVVIPIGTGKLSKINALFLGLHKQQICCCCCWNGECIEMGENLLSSQQRAGRFLNYKRCLANTHTEGSQWLSVRVLYPIPRGRGFEPQMSHNVVSLSKNINPSLVLVQLRKTRPFITERVLMGR